MPSPQEHIGGPGTGTRGVGLMDEGVRRYKRERIEKGGERPPPTFQAHLGLDQKTAAEEGGTKAYVTTVCKSGKPLASSLKPLIIATTPYCAPTVCTGPGLLAGQCICHAQSPQQPAPGRHPSPHFKNEKTEAQGNGMIGPRLGWPPDLPDPLCLTQPPRKSI